jgi:aminoglycoside phosphotransferase
MDYDFLQYYFKKVRITTLASGGTDAKLHAVTLDASVPYWSLEGRLQVAKFNLQEGSVDQDDSDPQFKHLALHELFEAMMKIVPKDHDEVCIHGDYCLDNLLFNGDALSGFIDMGRGGRGDRYHDLAIAVRTIREAFGEKMLGPFFSTYGLNDPSLDKLRFYTMLDEFY